MNIWMVNYDQKGVHKAKFHLESINYLNKVVHLGRQGRE
ncbi:MAG: hypothetical protein XXXJIFNMEKO3_03146 [Candidatus Erwinia impunctatus]|nr:hypothetical protein XXXJIFNMEKO_03146 [Culicoides impunctatus]